MKLIRFSMLSFFGLVVSVCSRSQVNLQTGAAEYNIPLYSYNDPGSGLSTGISLVYTGGNGLKVNEVPSEVGAGWELITGGSIQRIQRGEPDDQKNNDTYSYPFVNSMELAFAMNSWAQSYFPNGYLYSQYSPANPVDNGGAYTPLLKPGYNGLYAGQAYKRPQRYLDDYEQDVFSYNIGGRVGYFVISKGEPGNPSIIRTLHDTRLKIDKVDGDLNNTENIRTTISEFKITDEHGIQYFFRDAEKDEYVEYDHGKNYDVDGTPLGDANWGYTVGGPASSPVRLFRSLRGTAKNQYVKNKWYLSEIKNPLTGQHIIFEYDDYNSDYEGEKIASYDKIGNNSQVTVTILRHKGVRKRLKKIILTTKETVEFAYSTLARADISTEHRLEHISIKYDDDLKARWTFDNGYFFKNEIKPYNFLFSPQEKVWARLCLMSLKKENGLLSAPPYKFNYYLNSPWTNYPTGVPPLFSFYQDPWGYYCPLSFGYYNPLTQTSVPGNPLYEPYGETLLPVTQYTAAASTITNMAMFQRPDASRLCGVIKDISTPIGGIMSFEYETPEIDNINNLTGASGVRVLRTRVFDGITHTSDIVTEYKYLKEDEVTPSGWGAEPHILQKNLAMSVYESTNGSYPGSSYAGIALSFGSGIAQSALSTGVASNFGGNIWVFIIRFIILIFSEIFNDPWNDFVMEQSSSLHYNAHNILPFQYSRVEVLESRGVNMFSKSVYSFTSPDDYIENPNYQIDVPTLTAPFSSKQRYAYWIYGLPKTVEYFDKNGVLVSKIKNTYNPIKYSTTDNRFLSQKWAAAKETIGYQFQSSGFASNDIIRDFYYPIFGRIELTNTKEFLYQANGDFTIKETNYEYSSSNYLIKKVSSTNSKGELIEENSYYPEDYNVPGAIQVLKDNNIINVTVAKQSLVTRGGQKYIAAGNVSEFNTIANNDVKATATYSLQNTVPLSSSTAPFNSSQLIPNNTYYKKNGEISYNSSGLPVDIHSDKGVISTIYDYGDKISIASIANASQNQIAYSSFEADGNGGWVMNGSVLTAGGITGENSFSGTLSKSALPSGNYTITLWSKDNGNVRVNGSTGLLLHTIGVWKLYKWNLFNITSVNIIADNIDELRLIPENAAITSVTYDPLVGKTSECDASNRIIYYEYDALGRLRFERDENRNIVKMYEYNFKK